MTRPKRFAYHAAVAGLVLAAAAAVLWYQARLPRRFAVVDPGRLYRCGSVSPSQLSTLCRTFGIRRVICLLDATAPQTQAERAAAERLGIEWQNVPLPGDGSSTPVQREQLRRLVTDATGGPTLVHCAAGVNRTGLVVGMYRLHREGWTLEQVLREMRAFGFEDRAEHENLRQALAEEAVLAAGATRPASPP